MNLYIISYEYQNKVFSAYFPAENWPDAEKRLAALKATGQVHGEHIETQASDVGVAESIIAAINTGRNL